MKFHPHNYQEYTIQKIIDDPIAGIFQEMGLGKTVSTLTAISELKDYHGRILVIAPLFIAGNVWNTEINKWDHLQHLTISKILGTAKKRTIALRTKADIYIINRENTVWLVDQYQGKKWPFAMLVIDELSSFKNPKAKRFLALKKIRPKIERMVGLTGTPSPRGLMDLWAQIFLLDGGIRLGKYITHYRDRYFNPGKSNGRIVYEWIPKPEANSAIHNKISDICISMRVKDYLSLPPVMYNKVAINLPDKIQKQYKDFKREYLLPLRGEEVITAGSAGVLVNKLLQFSNGAIYKEDGSYVEIHDAKLAALKDIVDTATGNILLFYNFRHDLERIQKTIKGIKLLKTSNDIKSWNAGNIPILLAHPKSCGHGLNLQSGGSIIIWFGPMFDLEIYLQANARLYRQGQSKNVIIHHLICNGTIDEHAMNSLQNKEVGQDALMKALKAEIGGI
jgi:SNF2 family DNA or RNA helicase